MTNINDRKNYPDDSRVRQPISGVTGTNETNMREGTTIDQAAYRDGYVHGRNLEQERLEADREVRDNDNAARGMLLGILLTGLVGLTVGATYFLSQRNQTPVQNSTIVIPKASPSPAQSPQVIERDRIVPIPVPQQQSPAPNINVTVPGGQAPVAQPAPARQAVPAAPPTSSGSTQPDSSSSPPAGSSSPGASSTAPTGGTAPSSSSGTGQ